MIQPEDKGVLILSLFSLFHSETYLFYPEKYSETAFWVHFGQYDFDPHKMQI